MRRGQFLQFAATGLLLAGAVVAQDFDSGMAAYRDGDYERALREWKPLAEQGVTAAQYGLGILYERGLGVPQDARQAFDWFLRAARLGDPKAQYMVSAYYGRGDAVEADLAERLKWLFLAARQGHTAACIAVARSLFDGQGAPQDSVLAYIFANRAADTVQSDEAAEVVEKLLVRITAAMTPEQIEEGDLRLANIRARNSRPSLLDDE